MNIAVETGQIRPEIFMGKLPGLAKPIPIGGFEDVILLSESEVAARAAIVAKVESAVLP